MPIARQSRKNGFIASSFPLPAPMVTQTGRLGDIELNPARLDKERRGRLTRAALDYLRRLKNPSVKIQ